MTGKPTSSSSAEDVKSLGESAHNGNEENFSLDAPNFSLLDFHRKLHSLTNYRRKRVSTHQRKIESGIAAGESFGKGYAFVSQRELQEN